MTRDPTIRGAFLEAAGQMRRIKVLDTLFIVGEIILFRDPCPEKTEILRRLCEESDRLLKQRPLDHHMINDAGAVVFIAKLHAQGFNVETADAERCVQRMRVAVETGMYPLELLDIANQERRGSREELRRMDGGPVHFAVGGVEHEGRLNFRPELNFFEVLFLPPGATAMAPPIVLTEEMIAVGEIREGVLHLGEMESSNAAVSAP